MSPDRSEIVAYYARKVEGYRAKFAVGYVAHLHSGLYERSDSPLLFEPKVDLAELGIDRLRFLLVQGQERLTSQLLRLTRPCCGSLVLDCGAGHGGTAIRLAQEYGCEVHALTLSSEQVEEIQRNARLAGVAHRVQAIAGDVFDGLPIGARYDLIVGFESFCQMGRPDELYGILSKGLRPGGRLAVSDYFCDSPDLSDIRALDRYWNSQLVRLDAALAAAAARNLRVNAIVDDTVAQTPFWELSVAYSRLCLRNGAVEEERARLQRSIEAHSLMARAFRRGILSHHTFVVDLPEGA